MAEAIVSVTVQKLGQLLLEEPLFLFGIGDQVKQLQDELKRLNCFLKDADEKQHESERVRNWVAGIREASYDAEDILEAFFLKAESRKQKGMKRVLRRLACILNEAVSLHSVGSEIREITSRLSKIAASMLDFGIKESMGREGLSLSDSLREQRQSFPYVVEHNLVGLEQSLEKLVNDLVSGGEKLRVTSICGMGGLGKTTLAKQIFHHHKVRRHFDRFAWVYVSQDCRRRHVWQDIFLNLSYKDENQRILSLRDEQLGEELHRFLKRNKCLIVLDDIWGKDAWDCLKHVFPHETGSEIILTTRNKEVALYADPRGVLHEPQLLTCEESWELLEKISLSGRENIEPMLVKKMEEIGKQIVVRCGGLPLAITVLGGLLATKSTWNEWQRVCENIKSYVSNGGSSNGSKNMLVADVLCLSYEYLPPHVKQCFLYFAHYPEDYEVHVGTLVSYCIAEGMVMPVKHTEAGTTVEDVGQDYLEELVKRSMVMVGRRDIVTSEVMTCRMHDLMREVCLQKAKQESFVQVIDSRDQDEAEAFISLSTNTSRRISVQLHGGAEEHHIKSLSQVSFRKMKLLRVLDLEGAQIEGGKLPDDVGDLIHLRNLSVRLTNVKELTSSIGNLKLMITLDLFVKGQLYIPNQLWDFPVGKCNPRDLLAMTSLRRLSINLSSQNTDFVVVSSLSKVLKRLRGLTINVPCEPMLPPVDVTQLVSAFTNLCELELFLKLEKLPGEQSFSSDLGALRLWQCGLVDDPFMVLEKLPNLKILQLFEGSFVGSKLCCSKNLENLEEWTVEDGAMMRLVTVELKCCNKLKSVPEGTRFLKNLQEVEIGNRTKAFKDKLISGGEDFYKVQHVPCVVFENCEL
ncbi:NB-ARC domain-containing disease resistance protein [Arabidopsis thaliana]|uniref:Putative disease resistance protein At1g50180 n=1 Tax=Arabidopsis thaliana TaxID=3702 RepID=DRL4_ARATH|nr:NB-ARC domain-containing disease resistance protein [Arabidopsis thaliana]Q9SX38.2 RecName: Full=Putative disease resistance protein At1g50180 [Arabidopsis thaliana]AEE32522.1 NB-ARC domain-containing disease resistance protein [Arabidopsis thaliana]|eukprot:NP_175437.1 NB-ARC domain-containing disease resistance protein [Arabidopsis thaliana]